MRLKLHTTLKYKVSGSPLQFEQSMYKLQCPPLQLVHRVFGEFETDAASIQPSPKTFDFVLEACGLLADFYPDEGVRQQLFNKHLEHYLNQSIYRVKLTSGVSETDGSIVNTPNMPEVTVPCCKVQMMNTHQLACNLP